MVKIVRVLDASGINRGSLDFSEGGYCIPPSVRRELHEGNAKTAVEEAIRAGSIVVSEPAKASLETVAEAAKETGDITSLSGPDMDVLAAAAESGLIIVSDDYAIQNTASKLGLKVEATSQKGIEKRITWSWTCGGCGKKASGPGTCPVCGHRNKRRPINRTSALP